MRILIRRLPRGYDTMVTSDGANLSRGSVSFYGDCRAAISDPPVLILDEATSGIDTRTEALIEKGMDRLMEGRTVFVIAHRLSTVRKRGCDPGAGKRGDKSGAARGTAGT